MSAEDTKNLRANAPFDRDAANEFGVYKFTGGVAATETTHSANAIPSSWCGRQVGMMATGGVCHVGFSTRASGQEIDRAVAATAAGATAKVGLPLPDSLSVVTPMRIPDKEPSETMYFVRESSATGTIVYMWLMA